MEGQQSDALLQRSGSSETMTAPARNSNAKAFKVAGLTLLACLLLAGQAITVYFVMGQREHISALERGQENLKMEFTHKASAAPKMMHMPMNSISLVKSLIDDDGTPKETVPLSRVESSSFQREGSGLIYGSRLAPKRMQLSMGSLPLTEEKSEDVNIEDAMSKAETECQLAAKGQGVRPGFFTPQCDEKGEYLPMQCWHSTGYCWCVDKHGKEIPNTAMRGRPHCGDVN